LLLGAILTLRPRIGARQGTLRTFPGAGFRPAVAGSARRHGRVREPAGPAWFFQVERADRRRAASPKTRRPRTRRMICVVRSGSRRLSFAGPGTQAPALGVRETRTDAVEGETARSLNRFGMNSRPQGETREIGSICEGSTECCGFSNRLLSAGREPNERFMTKL